jgi:parallel beta-helix repeat protein
MRINFFVMVLALIGLGFAYDLSMDVLQPDGNDALYNDSSTLVSVNVSCGSTDCGDIDVSLMAVRAPSSCEDILSADPGAGNGIYLICTDSETCKNVYCDMENGGYASIFTMDGALTLDSRNCLFFNYNDDMDSTILWTDLTGKIETDNGQETSGANWYTWNRDGSEDMVPAYLPDRPGGLGNYARPVPLPAAEKTVWFDWENSLVVWGGGSATFSELGLDPGTFSSYYSFYFISDGVNMIHAGPTSGSAARLLTFDFVDDSVSSEAVDSFHPPNGWWGTEEDSFGHVLYTVNGRVMYFDSDPYPTGYFALGGNLSAPDALYDTYAVELWMNPSQPGLDFFTMVDESGYLWFGDWGHDNGGYFNCDNDDYLGVGKTNIMLTYNGSIGAMSADLVSTAAGASPFYTTDANPATVSLLADEAEVVDYDVFATEPGVYLFYAIANETGAPYASNISDVWSVRTLNRVPPVPAQSAPRNNYYMYPGDISLNFSCGAGIIDTVELWADTGGSWGMIYSNSSYSEGALLSVTVPSLSLGNYTWAVWCNATYGGEAWSPNRSIHVTDTGVFMCTDISSADTYTLLTDIYADPSSTCFDILAEDVVLDCAGYSIIGTGCSSGESGVYSNYLNTTVRNCTISNFCNNIYLDSGSGNGLIERNNLTDSTYGVRLEYTDFNSVLFNNFEGNDYGFYLYYADNNQIGRNRLIETDETNFATGSCPFLFLWDGDGYDYYTDLAGESIGAPWFETPLLESGIYELGDFKSTGGMYKMKIREVIPESDFVDEIKLAVVDVPEGYGVLNQWHNTYSDNEAPPKGFMTIKDPKKPITATDRYGNDVLGDISEADGAPLQTHDGEPNSVIVDFGGITNPQYAKLVITGWSSYEDNPELSSLKNLKIETLNDDSSWVTAKLFGKFTGDSRTFVFDIANILEANDTRMRITAPYSKTTINVIDQVLLDDSEPVDIEITYIDPSYANLQWGGSTTYEYATTEHRHIVSDESLPNVEKYLMYGNFTKYGDVRPLVGSADDKFAIMRHGDELALEFVDIAPVDGKDRHIFLESDIMYTIRYSVKGQVSDSIDPMPFHGMSAYPYGTGESYPNDADHNAYRTEWNTRVYEPPVKYGGSLPYSYNNTVFENVFIGDEYSTALYLEYEDATQLLYNNISGVEVGIDIYDSDDTIVTGNLVYTEGGRGLILHQYSSGSTVTNNTFYSDSSSWCDYDGCGSVYFGRTDDNLLQGNNLTSIGGYGFVSGYSDYNDILDNSITSPDDYAIYVWGSSDNTFLRNWIVSDYWVDDQDGGNYFDDGSVGNAYFTADGTPASEIFDITDSDNDSWADAGSDIPFSCDTVGDCGSSYEFWAGYGEDWHPYTNVTSNATPTPSSHNRPTPELSISFQSSCDGNIISVTSGSDTVPEARVYVTDADTGAAGYLRLRQVGECARLQIRLYA